MLKQHELNILPQPAGAVAAAGPQSPGHCSQQLQDDICSPFHNGFHWVPCVFRRRRSRAVSLSLSLFLAVAPSYWLNLPPSELQKAAEHRPPFSTGSETPLPRALGVCGEEEGELGFDVVRGSLRCVEPGQSRHSQQQISVRLFLELTVAKYCTSDH